VEWNDHAVETFRLNFPDVPVWHGDIAQLSVEECHEMIDLVFALGGHHKVELFLEE
jgi:site-specific DNA-cytosine methylase